MNKFPIELLPDDMQKMARAILTLNGAPAELSGPTMLAAASFVSQGVINVDPTGEFSPRPTSLFCMPLAKSGGQKSTIFSTIFKPIQDFVNSEREMFGEESTIHEQLHKTWKREFDKISDPDIARSKAADEPRAPINPARFSEKTTPKALIERFRDAHPAQAIVTAEGGNFLHSHAFKSEMAVEMATMLINGWDGSPQDRSAGGESVYVQNRRLMCLILTQPTVAEEFLSNENFEGAGLLARFLVNNVEEYKPPKMDRFTSAGKLRRQNAQIDKQDFLHRLSELVRVEHSHDRDRPNEIAPRIMKFCDEADRTMQDYYNNCIWTDANVNDAFKARKYEHACRIAAVLAYWTGEDCISDMTAAAGIALAEYYDQEWSNLSTLPLASYHRDEEKIVATIMKHLRQTERGKDMAKNGFTPNEYRRHGPRSIRKLNRDKFEKVLESMAADELLTVFEEQSGNGHMTMKFALNGVATS